MDINKFREAEEKYQDLRMRLDHGEIGNEEMKKELRKLMVLDDAGRYWIIGGKSGSWYQYDGAEWKPAMPYDEDNERQEPAVAEAHLLVQPAAPVSAAIAESSGDEIKTVLCSHCQSQVPEFASFCQFCGASMKPGKEKKTERREELQIQAIKILPALYFMGGFGLILGVILGAIFGIFPIWQSLLVRFPLMLQEAQGKFHGGLLFGALGGMTGFILFSLAGIIGSATYNMLAYFFCGLRLRVK